MRGRERHVNLCGGGAHGHKNERESGRLCSSLLSTTLGIPADWDSSASSRPSRLSMPSLSSRPRPPSSVSHKRRLGPPCSASPKASGRGYTTMRPFPRPEVRTHSPASSPPPHPRHSLSPADGPLRSESQPGHPPPRQPVPPRSVSPTSYLSLPGLTTTQRSSPSVSPTESKS